MSAKVKIENEIIQLDIQKSRLISEISSQFKHPQQKEIFALLQSHTSIKKCFEFFLKKGFLVSFQSIHQVLLLLLKNQLILNPSFYSYFNLEEPKQKSFLDNLKLTTEKDRKEQKSLAERLERVPFFRSLPKKTIEVFLKNSSHLIVSSGLVLCKQGQEQRSLLVLLQGQATVYRTGDEQSPQKIVSLHRNAVFGESGFFFGDARTADVMTDTPCEILVIKYVPELYDGMFNATKAKELQMRIWTIHALLKSSYFSALPQECFDALIFAGDIKKVPANAVLCKEGNRGQSCYLIVQGAVHVSIQNVFVRKMTQGELFGEQALLVSGGIRTATVVTTSETILLEIGIQRFYKLLSDNFLLACEFEKIAHRISRGLN